MAAHPSVSAGAVPLGIGKIAPAESGPMLELNAARAARQKSRRARQARLGVGGPLAGQRAQVPGGVDEWPRRRSRRARSEAAPRRLARQQRLDLLLALLRLERADAIDDRPPGLISATARSSRRRCRSVSTRYRPPLEPGDVRVAADRAGRRAGRIEQHRIERPALPFGRVGGDHFGLQAEPREVLAHPRQAGRRAVDRGDPGAGERQLHGLAAGRRAEVGDLLAGDVAEQAGRERRRGVLHPPGAFAVAGKQRDSALRRRCERCRSAARGRAGAAPSSLRRISP